VVRSLAGLVQKDPLLECNHMKLAKFFPEVELHLFASELGQLLERYERQETNYSKSGSLRLKTDGH
jgi:hypothetical protein